MVRLKKASKKALRFRIGFWILAVFVRPRLREDNGLVQSSIARLASLRIRVQNGKACKLVLGPCTGTVIDLLIWQSTMHEPQMEKL